jgi:sigma-E factor negative regulatory protein RseC
LIEESAVILARDGDFADVQALRRGACGSCGAKAACGTSLLDRFLGRRALRLRVVNVIDAGVGEQVVIGVPEAALLRAAVAAYLVPVTGMILGAILGQEIAGLSASSASDPLSIIGGLVGFGLALLWLRGYSARLKTNPRYRAVLLRRESGATAEVRFG